MGRHAATTDMWGSIMDQMESSVATSEEEVSSRGLVFDNSFSLV